MDIKIPHSLLTQYLKTKAKPEKIAQCLSLCGPTVDLLEPAGDDWLYHLEVITNRVDAASAFGIAREANAILPEFEIDCTLTNDPYTHTLSDIKPLTDNQPVEVTIANPSLAPRFACIAFSSVTIKSTPMPVQNWLNLSGQRPINNLIDISNELTLKYGQPVHIFDLDKIKDRKMTVRESLPGETITTLDNRRHKLKGGDIVIEDGAGRLIDLCGIMGGALSAVDEHTRNILLFVQTYDPKKIRRTSLYTQERTLASQLFEKQTDPDLVLPVLIEGAQLIQTRSGGKIASSLINLDSVHRPAKTIQLDLDWLNRFSGIELSDQQVINILMRLGFTVPPSGNSTLDCQVPSWRYDDINLKEDLAEEVMRVYGYFRLPSTLPPTTLINTQTDPLLTFEQTTRYYLSHLGFTEIYNYSLIGEKLAAKSKLTLKSSLRLSNPLSTDYEYMRLSLLPSLLENLESNRGLKQIPVRLFELANIYPQAAATKLANETSTLALVTYGLNFLQSKGYLEALAKNLNLSIDILPETKPLPPFSLTKTGAIKIKDQLIGHIGLLSADVKANFNLTEEVVITELNFAKLIAHINPVHLFRPVPLFQSIIEDLTFTLPEKTYLGPLISQLTSVHPLIDQVTLKDSYNQNFTFTLTYLSPDKQLTTQDVEPVRKKVVAVMEKTYHAKLVGQLK
jgi:phenylalanyl-tRNA synthetase beta chain